MEANGISLPVDHVSDTAYLVALYRAFESESQNPAIIDPFAKRLAAPKADWLENVVPFHQFGVWMMAIRTRWLDELILKFVSEGADTVINLAAGLDTRPYRMNLPKNLRWVEADFAEITDYKSRCLQADSPRCQLTRKVVDLSVAFQRRSLLSEATKDSDNTIVITEGLLPYLTQENVLELSQDLYAQPAIQHWIMDLTSTNLLEWFRSQMTEMKSGSGSVTLQFAPQKGAEFFQSQGWREDSFISFVEGTERLHKSMPKEFIADQTAIVYADESGVLALKK